jgi:hypothetical protein
MANTLAYHARLSTSDNASFMTLTTGFSVSKFKSLFEFKCFDEKFHQNFLKPALPPFVDYQIKISVVGFTKLYW